MADFVIANASEAVHAAARRDVDRVSKSSDVILRHEHLRASKDDRARGLSFEDVAITVTVHLISVWRFPVN